MIPLKDNVRSPTFPVVTAVLIALCTLAFAWQLTLSDSRASSLELSMAGVSERDAFTIEHGAVPFRLAHPGSNCGVTAEDIVCGKGALTTEEGSELIRVPDDLDNPAWWTTPLTSMFMHVDFLHFLVAMLALLIFGRTVEATIGRAKFLALYLLSGIAAIYLQVLWDPNATGPIIGASGAVAGVMGFYAAAYARARVVGLVVIPVFGTLVEIGAWWVIGAWWILELVPGLGRLATPDVADETITYLAHLAVFAIALGVGRLAVRRTLPFERGETAVSREPGEPVHG
ncbi:MAG: rhomboid family intramembrane serine protease [Solirubrobacterales bacterium]